MVKHTFRHAIIKLEVTYHFMDVIYILIEAGLSLVDSSRLFGLPFQEPSSGAGLKHLLHAGLHLGDFFICELRERALSFVLRQAAIVLNA